MRGICNIDSLVIVAIKGTVMALDRATGQEIWRTPLKGGTFVNLVLDRGDLIATTKGEVFCLDPADGRVRWNNPMTGMGWGLVTVATSSTSPMGPMAQQLFDEQDASNAAASAAIQ